MEQGLEPAVALQEAVAALRVGDRAKVAAIVGDLIAAEAPLGEQWAPVARMAAAIGEVGHSLEAIGRFVAIDPDDPARRLQQLAMLAEAGRIEEAIALGEPLAGRWPGNAPIRHFLGTAHAQMGDTEKARAHLLAALVVWPAAGASWLALASLGKQRRGEGDFDAIVGAGEAIRGASAEARAGYHYALGKTFDDVGERTAALAEFVAGAGLIRPMRPYDQAADVAFVERLIAAESGANRSEGSDEAGRAIFVVGLPRSGTTLVEQILASHDAVIGGGEISLFDRAARGAGVSPGSTARTYAHLLDQRFGLTGRVVDKTLANTRLIGPIRRALPGAPFIWVRRDPLDAAWSCFRTFFAQGLAGSWSPADIANHFAAEERLFRHWSEDERVLVVPYRGLVTEPDRWIPAILGHCGLAEQPQVRRFHETRRAVTTSSVAQVRRPIHRDAIGIAPEYRAFMEPVVEMFERLTG